MNASGPAENGHVDQIVFGLVNSGAGAEMGVAASSFPPGSAKDDMWSQRLKHHVRLQPSQVDGRTYLPARSLSYLEFGDGSAAVVRRVDNVKAGRNHSHALVGTAADLRPNAAALWSWRHWLDEPTSTPQSSLHVNVLKVERSTVTPGLDDRSYFHHRLAVPIVAAALTEPGTRLTVLGAPEEVVMDLIWLLQRITEPLFPVAPTFSTYEVSDDRGVQDLPSMVFLRTTPAAGETAHRRLYLDEPPPADRTTEAARLLVERYVDHASTGATAEYRQWLSRLVDSRTGDRAKADLLVRELAGAEPSAAAPASAAPPRHEPAGGRRRAPQDDGDSTMVLDVTTPRTTGEQRPRWRPVDLSDDQLVLAIARAEDTAEVLTGLDAMHERIGESNHTRRLRIQRALLRNDFLVPVVSEALAGDMGDQWIAFMTIMEFGYGPEGRDLRRRGALTVMNEHLLPNQSGSLFLHVVRDLAVRNGKAREFDELLGWVVRRRYPKPAELGGRTMVPPLPTFARKLLPTPPRGAVALRYRWDAFISTPLSRQMPLALVLVFTLLLLGIVVGRLS